MRVGSASDGHQEDSERRNGIVPLRVLLIGARLCRNLGGPSMLVTTRSVFNQVLAHPEYTFLSPTREDLALSKTYNIHILPPIRTRELIVAALAKAWLGLSVGSQDVRKVINAYAEANIVVDILGIMFADSLRRNTFLSRGLEGLHLLVAKLFRKPVVKYTADLGPFEAKWNRFFAKLYLQHTVDLVLARSDTTKRRLEDLGVTTPAYVCPDTAFLLESETFSLTDDLTQEVAEGPVVGLSVSHMAVRQSAEPEQYYERMARLADHIIESTGAKVVLIPNERPVDPSLDDEHVSKDVQRRMASGHRVLLVSGAYTAQQIKGIIGYCDIVVAARYHTIVASLSQGIPVLAVGWHAKYAAVLGLVGQDRYLCSVDSLEEKDLHEMFDALWKSRESIRGEIEAALPEIRRAILACGEQVGLLLSDR